MLLLGEFQGKIGKVQIWVRLSFKLYYYTSPTLAMNMVMCVSLCVYFQDTGKEGAEEEEKRTDQTLLSMVAFNKEE